MGKITNILVQEKDKERCNVYIDGEFRCGLSIDFVFSFGLKVGQEITQEKLLKIAQKDDEKRAFNKALKFVSKAMKTKWQVKDYLVKKGFSEQASWSAVDKLKEYGFIDDVEFAKSYIETYGKTQGKNLIKSKLISKGVQKDDINKAYELVQVNFVSSAVFVANKYLKNKEKTKENLLKACRYLVGRGFSYEEAKNAVASLGDID